MALFFFTFQIYGDFSGYSDIAIGTAKLFGINLMQNFHYPYLSRTLGEFWQRWHISLNKWFVEYVYIPLGGSRCPKVKVMRNTMVVFLLSGLWHGASWTFIVWGAYHGMLLVFSKAMGQTKAATPVMAYSSRLPSIKESISVAITFALVVIGWIIFRADTLSDAVTYVSSIFANGLFQTPSSSANLSMIVASYTFAFIVMLQIVEYIQRHRPYALDLTGVRHRAVRWLIYLTVVILIVIFCGTREPFIYFQF